MKNKDGMQFNLKNWEKRGFFGNFWDKNDKRVTFKKILNKDKYKKKWGDKMKDYQSWSLSTEEISSQFDEKFAKLKEYLESKNKGKLKELENKISECEKMREQYDKINNYGENL